MAYKNIKRIFLMFILLMLIALAASADRSISLKACYPEKTNLLPEAVDSEEAEADEIFPGITNHKVHVWSISGPLRIHLVFCDMTIPRVDVEFKKSSGAKSEILTQMGAHEATIAGASLMPSLAISPQTINIKDLQQALSIAPPLIQKGKSVFDANSSSVKSESPLTVCGAGFLDGGKRFVIAVVDGRQPNYSIGMSEGQLAEYMLFLGCRDAYLLNKNETVALVTRGYGEVKPSLYNAPRGSKEPAVSSAMYIVSRNPKGKPFRLIAKPDAIDVIAGKTIPIRATLIDKFNNILSAAKSDIKIKPASLGEMIGDSFQSGASAGSGMINIELNGAKARIPVRVFDTLKEIRLDRDSASILPGNEETFKLIGIATDGTILNIPAEHAEWIADGGCGSFIAPGKFKADRQCADGFIEVSAAGAKCRIPLVVGEQITNISDFGVGGEWKVRTSSPRISGSMDITIAQIEEEKKVVGWMRFEIEKSSETTVLNIQRNIPLTGEPRKIGLSIKGSARNCRFKGVFMDSFEHENTLLFSTNTVFSDWTRHVVDIPQGVAYPIVWKRFALESPPVNDTASGNIFLTKFETISAPALPARPDNDYQTGAPPSWLELSLLAESATKPSARFFAFGNANISKSGEGESEGGSLPLKFIEYFKKRGGDFALSTGNLTSDGMGETLGAARSHFLNLPFKFYNTLGLNEKRNDPSLLNYASIMFPTHYSVTTGDVSLIVLDNTAGGFTLSDPQQTPREAQWQWLLQQLRQMQSNTLIISCHICPMGSTAKGYTGAMNPVEAETFHKLIVREKNKGRRVMVLSGNHTGFRMIVRDEIPYITTGGGDAVVENISNDGDISHYLEFNVTKNKIIYAIRPLFNRLVSKMNPQKNEANIGEEIEFTATGTIDIPARKIKRVVPLKDPMSFEWRISNKALGAIGSRDGRFKAAAAGEVEISITTGDMESVETINVLKSSE